MQVHPEANALWTINPPSQTKTFSALILLDSPCVLDLLAANSKSLNLSLAITTSPATSAPQLVLPLETEAPFTPPNNRLKAQHR